jgi:hypothetical protein
MGRVTCSLLNISVSTALFGSSSLAPERFNRSVSLVWAGKYGGLLNPLLILLLYVKHGRADRRLYTEDAIGYLNWSLALSCVEVGLKVCALAAPASMSA